MTEIQAQIPVYFNFVYCTVNKINGKCYVGSHRTKNLNDNYLGSGRYFIKSITKNGRKNFIRIIIKHYDDIIDARKAEAYYIELFDSIVPNGYNLSPKGGLKIKGCHSLESIEKIREGNKGKKRNYTKEGKERLIESASKKGGSSWNKGISPSLETRDKMSNSKKGKPSWNKNKKLSEEHKDKLRLSALKNKIWEKQV